MRTRSLLLPFFVFSLISAAGASAPSSPDNWLGGAGNWSDASKWSAGLPGANSDVIINTGHDDVALDTSASIRSLTIGGPKGYALSTLKGTGTAETLNVAQALTLNQSGSLQLISDTCNVGGNVSTLGDAANPNYISIDFGSALNVAGTMQASGLVQLSPFGHGGDTLTVAGSLTTRVGTEFIVDQGSDAVSLGTFYNSGDFYLQTGAVLTLTNTPGGITTILPGSTWEIHGTVTSAGNPPFPNLQTVRGFLEILNNAEATVITPPNGTLLIDGGGLYSAASLQINGNVVANFGGISGSDAEISGWVSVGVAAYAGGTTSVAQGVTTSYLGQVELVGSDVFTTPALTNEGFSSLQNSSSMIVGQQTGKRRPATPGYQQTSSGVLSELIAANTFGVVQAPTVSLDGTLKIVLLPGVVPPVGSRYEFIAAEQGGLSGQFATIINDVFNDGTEKWVVGYNFTNGFVELIAEQNNASQP